MAEVWRRIVLVPDSSLFSFICNKIKEVQPGEKSLDLPVINKRKSQRSGREIKETYRIDFQWQNDDVCGFDVFKKEGEDGKPS